MRATWFAGSGFALALLLTGLDACKSNSEKRIAPATGGGSAASSGTGGNGSAGGEGATATRPSDTTTTAATGDGGTTSTTCVPRDDDVFVAFDKQVLVCAVEAKRCFTLDPETGATAVASYHDDEQKRTLVSATVETRDGKPAACVRDKCRVLGPNVKKDLETVDAADRDDVAGTVDLGALVVPIEGDWHIWDIARDRRIELRAPSPEQGLSLVWPSGNELYVTWAPPDERVYSSAGKEVASLCNEGSQLVALDDTHWAALTGDHKLHLFGEPRHAIDLADSLGYSDWTESLGITPIGGGNLAVALVRPTEAVVALVDPRRGTVYKRWPLALCP